MSEARGAHEDDLARGEFVTGDELAVLRAVWLVAVDPPHHDRLDVARAAKCKLSLVERVETMLFPNGRR